MCIKQMKKRKVQTDEDIYRQMKKRNFQIQVRFRHPKLLKLVLCKIHNEMCQRLSMCRSSQAKCFLGSLGALRVEQKMGVYF